MIQEHQLSGDLPFWLIIKNWIIKFMCWIKFVLNNFQLMSLLVKMIILALFLKKDVSVFEKEQQHKFYDGLESIDWNLVNKEGPLLTIFSSILKNNNIKNLIKEFKKIIWIDSISLNKTMVPHGLSCPFLVYICTTLTV